MSIEVQDRKITVKPPAFFRLFGCFAIFMALSGLELLTGCFPIDPDNAVFDIFGIVFICIWMALLFVLGGKAFQFGFKTVTIDERGVTSRWLRSERTLSWAEIKDYGALYAGRTGSREMYILYFADKEQRVKKRGRKNKKKLKGAMIKTYLMDDSYASAVVHFFPFCKNYTELEPFIGIESRS